MRARSLAAWLPSAALLVHASEELPRFPAWATARFGTTTTLWFVVSHLPIFAVALLVSWRASRPAPSRRARWRLLVFVAALGTNALFHLGASLAWRELAPGLYSALLLHLPLTALLAPRLARELGAPAALRAVAAGVAVAIALIATLFLDVPVG